MTKEEDDDVLAKRDWRAKLHKAKRLHRPSLKDWEMDQLHKVFSDWRTELSSEPRYSRFTTRGRGDGNRHGNGSTSTWDVPEGCEGDTARIPVVLEAARTPPDAFHALESKRVPCVIRGIPAGREVDGGGPWKAQENWNLDSLRRNEKLLYRPFKCGEDDDGKTIKVKLTDFLEYTKHNKDDSPLYIFDSTFDEDSSANRLLADYRVPSYFTDDLFGLVSESRRPPYRWFLIGPERSGTCVHIDPLATSAWNTLVKGQKRWVLFPPHTPKELYKGRGLVRDDEDDEAIHYFMTILPRIKRKAASMYGYRNYHETSSHGKDDDDTEHFVCYEFTQNAGETVYVPHGWAHAVLNLTDTVAVTQNFCSQRNFDAVWLQTRKGRKRMAWKWLQQLKVRGYAHLADRALAMNERDNFIMKYDPIQIAKREEEERRRKEQRRQRKKEKSEQKPPPYDMCYRREMPDEMSIKRSRVEASY